MKKILHLCQILRQPDSIHAPGLCRDILFNHYKGVPRNFHWRGPGRGEVWGVGSPCHWVGDWGPDFFFIFQMEMVHLYAMFLLKTTLLKVKTSSAAANYDGLDMKSSAKAMLGVTLRQLPARQCQVKT